MMTHTEIVMTSQVIVAVNKVPYQSQPLIKTAVQRMKTYHRRMMLCRF